MACFIIPGTEAIVTTIATKIIKSKEKEEILHISNNEGVVEEVEKIKFSTKLGWLNKMLWGGSALLAFEHMWHGEITPFFPFLTAIEKGETLDMLAEMSTTGVLMAVFVTAVWACSVIVSSIIEKRAVEVASTKEETV